MDLLMAKRTPVMLIGGAGSGKSVIVADKLTSLPESYSVANLPFNYYTTSGNWYFIFVKYGNRVVR